MTGRQKPSRGRAVGIGEGRQGWGFQKENGRALPIERTSANWGEESGDEAPLQSSTYSVCPYGKRQKREEEEDC